MFGIQFFRWIDRSAKKSHRHARESFLSVVFGGNNFALSGSGAGAVQAADQPQ